MAKRSLGARKRDNLSNRATVHAARIALGDDALVDEKAAAKLLGIRVGTLANMRRAGVVTAGSIGRRIVYSVGMIRRLSRTAAAGHIPVTPAEKKR